ncbi:UNVERIFIED_ORG: Superfamily II DNA helicase [Gordonia westfalica J30]
MYDVTRLITIGPNDGGDHGPESPDPQRRADVVERIATAALATGASTTLVAPTLPGVRNGGDVIAHLQFDSVGQWRTARDTFDAATSGPEIAHVNSVEYPDHSIPALGSSGRRQLTSPATIYRTLLLRVDAAADTDDITGFEQALLRMPRHITSIQAWRLSRVAVAGGDSDWTHVWEQEFTDLDGLLGQYMNHPIHWASVDPYFDPESPKNIVKDRVCHSFCRLESSIPGPARPALALLQESQS